jgi:hypothetical protein
MPINSANINLSLGTATLGTPTFNNNVIVIPVSGLINNQKVAIGITNVNGIPGANVVYWRQISGDVSGDGKVQTANDINSIVNFIGSNVLTGAHVRRDLNGDGFINAADVALANGNLGTSVAD